MNWSLIGWFAGAIVTLYMIKFILMLTRRIFSKDTMTKIIDGTGNAASRTSERISDNLAEKIQQRRERKAKEKEENSPVVVIR